MANNYYVTLEIHDEGEWPRIAPEHLMQHVDVRLPSGLTLAGTKVTDISLFGEDAPITAAANIARGMGIEWGLEAARLQRDVDEIETVDALLNKEAAAYAIETNIRALGFIAQHDPDHLNPAKGGNQASDDYW